MKALREWRNLDPALGRQAPQPGVPSWQRPSGTGWRRPPPGVQASLFSPGQHVLLGLSFQELSWDHTSPEEEEPMLWLEFDGDSEGMPVNKLLRIYSKQVRGRVWWCRPAGTGSAGPRAGRGTAPQLSDGSGRGGCTRSSCSLRLQEQLRHLLVSSQGPERSALCVLQVPDEEHRRQGPACSERPCVAQPFTRRAFGPSLRSPVPPPALVVRGLTAGSLYRARSCSSSPLLSAHSHVQGFPPSETHVLSRRQHCRSYHEVGTASVPRGGQVDQLSALQCTGCGLQRLVLCAEQRDPEAHP